jgi:hypothetical protein
MGGVPGVSPSALAKPVATQEIEDDFMKAMQSAPVPVAPKGEALPETKAPDTAGDSMDADFASAMDSDFANAMNAGGSEEPSMLHKGLDVAGRVLDYAGGIVRGGAAATAGALNNVADKAMQGDVAGVAKGILAPEQDIVSKEDMYNIIKGRGPNSAEYLKRLGLSEGGSLPIPVIGDVSTRDVEGFALDVLSDPLTVVAKLAKTVPYIGKVINAGGAASEAIGRAVYKSSLSKVAEKVGEEGFTVASDALINAGKAGSAKKLVQAVEEMSDMMGSLRTNLYADIEKAGKQVDLSSFKRAEQVIEGMKANPGTAPAAKELEEYLARYKSAGKASVSDVSSWKSALYDQIPAKAFEGGNLRSQSARFKQALAADFQQSIIDTGESAGKGMGKAIDAVNKKWGPLLDSLDPLHQVAKKEGRILTGDTVDGIMLSLGGVTKAVARKAHQIVTTPTMSTRVGKAMIDAGKEGVVDAAMRRALINSQADNGNK